MKTASPTSYTGIPSSYEGAVKQSKLNGDGVQ